MGHRLLPRLVGGSVYPLQGLDWEQKIRACARRLGGGLCPLAWMQWAIKSSKCQPIEVLPKLKGSIKVEAVTLSWVEMFREGFQKQ